jgi:hypothetical protein
VVAHAVAEAEEEAAEQHQTKEEAEDGAGAERELTLGVPPVTSSSSRR